MGRSVVVYVIGLGSIISFALWNINTSTLSTVDTYMTYYGRTMVHNIATAVVNVGISQDDHGAFSPKTNVSWFGGTYDLYRTYVGANTFITAIARFPVPKTVQYRDGLIVDTVIAKLEKIPLRQYGRFSENEENIVWDGSDIRMHTNGRYWMWGVSTGGVLKPVFTQEVSAGRPWITWGAPMSQPQWQGGYIEPLNIPRVFTKLTDIADSAAKSAAVVMGNDVYLNFHSNGTVDIKVPKNGSIRNDHHVDVTAMAPGGVFAVRGGNLFIKGTYQGDFTLLSLADGVEGKGSIYVMDDGIRAADDPRFDAASPDFLGLCAENHILIETATRNLSDHHQTVYMQAASYTQNGIIGVENLFGVPLFGTVYCYGNEVAFRGSVFITTDYNHGLTNGVYYNDGRLKGQGPPMFPIADKKQLVSWWENENGNTAY